MSNGIRPEAFQRFPRLETERLVLRQFIESDADDLFDLRRDRIAQRYNDEPMSHRSQALDLIRLMAKGFADGDSIHWAVVDRESERVIGLFGVNNWNSYHRRASVGYNLERERWGHGLAREALEAIIQFVFLDLGAHRIEAETIVDNSESIGLLERLGFVREGVRRGYSREEDGLFHDSAIYSLLASDAHGRIRP